MRVPSDERTRVSPTPAVNASSGSMYAAKRFEMAFNKGQGDSAGAGKQKNSHRQSPSLINLVNPFADVDASEPLSPNVMHLFRQSLEHGIPDTHSSISSILSNLLLDITDSVRLGQRMPGDRWRILLRIQEELLAQTEIEIACTGGELSVVLRTADAVAYRCLVATLPELNTMLERREMSKQLAAVFWVGPEELR
jgi:hypothetical protein